MDTQIEWLTFLINKREQDKCVERLENMTLTDASKSINYLSDIKRAKFDIIRTNGDRITRSVILKIIPENIIHKKFVLELNVFAKEVKVYEEVLKPMKRIMDACSNVEEPLWGEIIGWDSNMIVLEDLCEKGYGVIESKKDLMGLETSRFVISSLGHYHALAAAALEKKLFDPNDYLEYMITEKLGEQFGNLLKIASEVIETSWGPQWKDVAARIRKLPARLKDKIRSISQLDDKIFTVLNHGDYKGANLMIKRDRNGKPFSLKMIDFQTCHYNSFGWDLTQVLYTTVNPSTRRAHLNELLRAYLDSLTEHRVIYGVKGTDVVVPTFEQVHEEVKRLRFFGFLLQILSFAVHTSELEKPVETEKFSNPAEFFNPKIYASEKYKNFVGEDFKSFATDGVFD